MALPPSQPAHIETAALYGGIDTYAYYYAELLIGSPAAQRASVIVDTGSRFMGIPCASCSHCGKNHIDPPFQFSRSITANWMPCQPNCNNGCIHDRCSYRESYFEGSSITGYWFTDFVRLYEPLQPNNPIKVQLGCHVRENKLFYRQKANGIMGMAPTNGSQPTILQGLFRDANSRIFSICLAQHGGRLTVGGYETVYHMSSDCAASGNCAKDGIRWTRMLSERWYTIGLQAAIVNEQSVGITRDDFGPAIVDSGSTYTYFPHKAYKALVAALESYCGEDRCSAQRMSTDCWHQVVPNTRMFPDVYLEMEGGRKVAWHPSAYMHMSPKGWRCYSFRDSSTLRSGGTILGISWMIHKDVIFDMEANRLGVAEALCPEHRLIETRSVLQGAFLEHNISPTWMMNRRFVVPSTMILVGVGLVAVAYSSLSRLACFRGDTAPRARSLLLVDTVE